MADHKKDLDKKIKDLRDAADELEKYKDQSPEEVDSALSSVQSCCGTCTGVSALPPCSGACIKISPLM